jgi:hypothetical protein
METSGTVDDVGWSSVVQNKKGKGKKKKKMQNARTLSLQVPCSSHVFFRKKNCRMYFWHFFPQKKPSHVFSALFSAKKIVAYIFRTFFREKIAVD